MLSVLVAGCDSDSRSTPDIPSFSFQNSLLAPESSVGSGSSSQTSVFSSAVSPEDPSPSDTSPSGSDISSGEHEISVPIENITQTLTLSHDPRNEKIIEISGSVMLIKGSAYDSPLADLNTYHAAVDVDLRKNGREFTAEIRLTDPSDSSFTVRLMYEDGHYDELVFKVDENGFALYDLSDIVETNRTAVKNAFTQPSKQVAEYIVKGGDPDEIRQVMSEIQALSDNICVGLNSDYDKLRAISRWVSANIYYDYPAFDKGIPAETLSLKYMLDKHSSVCGGYSNMTSALCAAQGIKCWNVHGSSLTGGANFATSSGGGEYHEWNFAEIDGRIVWLDAGWDSYCYLRRGGNYENGGIAYKYFDIGEEYLAANHKANYAEYRDYFALVQ